MSRDNYLIFLPPTPLPPTPSKEVALGGEVYPTNRAAIMGSWIALAVAIEAGGIFLVRRIAHKPEVGSSIRANIN